MIPSTACDPRADRFLAWNLWIVRLLAAAGLILSSYLAVVAFRQQGLPVGCGAGSGCASVLASPWSRILGLPVGALAAGLYGVLLITSCFLGRSPAPVRQRLWFMLLAGAAAIAGAAIWFTALQLFVVKAVCPWCVVQHAIGLAFASAVGWQVALEMLYGNSQRKATKPAALLHDVTRTDDPRSDQSQIEMAVEPFSQKWPESRSETWSDTQQAESGEIEQAAAHWSNFPASRFSTRQVVAAAAVGLTTVVLLAVTQAMIPEPVGGTIRLPPGKNADSGPGTRRVIAVLNGQAQFSPHKIPVLGSPDAPQLLLVLFDYCCPHCRATHGYLNDLRLKYDGQFAIGLLPVPMDHNCNPDIRDTEPRFRDACELARIALAVWRVSPERFAEFDAWLFETEMPRTAADARKHAGLLVGDALDAELRSPAIKDQIQTNIAAYRTSGAERIPIIMSPGFASIVGRPESREVLDKILRTELRIK